MTREVSLQRGGSARIESLDLQSVVLDVPFASPPGSTLMLVVADAPLGVKVRSCRRLVEEPARFRIEGRWVTLPRAQRTALGLANEA